MIAPAWMSMGESLLIGLLVGIERESDNEERHAGLRDFITIGLAGGVCGVLNQTWLTASALLALTALVAIFRIQTPGRTGITTEVAAVATFLLCVLTATPGLSWGSPLAIATSVVLALLLEARTALRKFFVETITEREFFDTLRFLAVIFVILPVLPQGGYGPYEFFDPRRIWIFVILVGSISYIGYFLQKFVGEEHGLLLTAVLGGIGSTTAATSAFARQASDRPAESRPLARATVVANAILNPRLLALLYFAPGGLWLRMAPVLAAMLVTGLAYAWWLSRGAPRPLSAGGQTPMGNPFRITPALKFGALFAAVRLLARFGSAEFGASGAFASSAVGGLVDVDAIVFSLPGPLRDGHISYAVAMTSVFIAIAANAVFKTGLAYSAGGRSFGRLVAAGFVLMLAVGGAVLSAVA